MELSADQVKQMIRAELNRRSGVEYGWYVVELYKDHAIVEAPDERLYRVEHTCTAAEDDSEPDCLELGEQLTPVQRVMQYLPIREAFGGRLLEAQDAIGQTWRVVLIAPGVSHNGVMYTPEVLTAAAPLFENVRALARSDDDHVRDRNVDPKLVVGWFEGVTYQDGLGLVATMHITADADWLSTKLVSAWDKGKTDLLGLSIVAAGKARRVLYEGRLVTWVETIESANFVDVVVRPSAGGRLLELVESEADPEGRPSVHAAISKESAMLERLLRLLEARHPEQYAQVDADNVTEDQLMELLESAPVFETATSTAVLPTSPVEVAPRPAQPLGSRPVAGLALTEADHLLARLQATNAQLDARLARAELTEALQTSELPEPVRAKLHRQFSTEIDAGQLPSLNRIHEAVEAERTMLSQLSRPGQVTGLGGHPVHMGEDPVEKAVAQLDNVFTQEHGASSFREAYVRLTGDVRVTGRVAEAHQLPYLQRYAEAQGLLTSLHESLTTSAFDVVLGSTLHRMLLREYTRIGLDQWRQIVEIVPLSDFRTNHRTRFGGYGNLPIVVEEGNYTALTSPTDEEATYSPAKRGGTESLTIEMIANDDVQAIRRIPISLGRAAAQTLHEFVFDFIATNPTIYDAAALFHASHNNIFTTAFGSDATQWFVHRNAMRQQAELDSSKRLGILSRHLLVPSDLEQAAYDAFTAGTNNDDPWAKRTRPNIIVVEYWTDANNFFSVCDPMDCPTIEIGFWDGEEPSLWTQDLPTVGSMFNNDTRTYKIRHVYGGAVLDFRGFVGSIVT